MGLTLPPDIERRVLELAGQAPSAPAPPPGCTEAAFQAAVLALAGRAGWLCYHTRDSRGSRAGFPDLVLVRRRIVWAELKTARGRVKPDQRAWLDRLRAAGQEVYLWRPGDWHEIEEVLR